MEDIVIKNWKRISKNQFQYEHRNGVGCTINFDDLSIHIGTWIPVGATILRKKFSSLEELITFLETTSWPFK